MKKRKKKKRTERKVMVERAAILKAHEEREKAQEAGERAAEKIVCLE